MNIVRVYLYVCIIISAHCFMILSIANVYKYFAHSCMVSSIAIQYK